MNDQPKHATQLSPGDDLYLRIAGGDEQAFRQAYHLFKSRLFFHARQFQLEWDEIKDVVADAFIALWNARAQLQSNEHLKNLLYFAVRNHALKLLESKSRRNAFLNTLQEPEQTSVDTDVSHRIIEAEMSHLLTEAISELGPDYRRIFELSYYEGKNPREIAAILDANPATVRSQKRRAIEMLRSWIQKRTFLLLLSISILNADWQLLKKILTFLARKG
ncbi:RNA polymerase sigma factor [Filimonas effusa]|uniref:RNA polymerase sigma factor n=1 Tax=Filimonas effusa TaxID=2508721 RepID=UPI0013E919D9|nr:sigma-70 family RNA polymerase sigma factor [Filimonas effusa]